MTDYPYATGRLVDAPNTYFYTQYQGRDFILAWSRDRHRIVKSLPKPVPPASAMPVDLASRHSSDLLERAMAGDDALREAFIKKFEIHKRVHEGYDDRFRALDKSSRRSFPLYLRAADLFQSAYEDSHATRHLNVYIKCLDTLCAEAGSLSSELLARLAWHLGREAFYIEALMANLGIAHEW